MGCQLQASLKMSYSTCKHDWHTLLFGTLSRNVGNTELSPSPMNLVYRTPWVCSAFKKPSKIISDSISQEDASQVLKHLCFTMGIPWAQGWAIFVAYTKMQNLTSFLAKDYSHTGFGVTWVLMGTLWPASINNDSDSWYTMMIVTSLFCQLLLFLTSLKHGFLHFTLP